MGDCKEAVKERKENKIIVTGREGQMTVDICIFCTTQIGNIEVDFLP